MPALALDAVVVDVAAYVVDAARDRAVAGAAVGAVVDAAVRAPPTLPSVYAWVERDTRAFWYSAGASAVTSLGAHVLVGLPVAAVTAAGMGGLAASNGIFGQALAMGLAFGVGGTYALAVSLLSSFAALTVFNGMSEFYEGRFVPALGAHFAGLLASSAVTALTFGGGLLMFHGAGQLAVFTGSAGLQTLAIFSFLGAMPAIVIAGIALVAVPALVTSWALSVSASPREGYAIDPAWLTSTSTTTAPTATSTRETAHYAMAVALPAL